ncbi:hypothetical protein MLD38_027468 [Melastoma candidum]|uniref:Uncharacterized protein n=1 Tax=Melastoma candidum TaxID=119954 RepID=A0ACB9P4U5_9MYRT|nr:hypothetical protein MLD38_027468 [Melastoma candidum]
MALGLGWRQVVRCGRALGSHFNPFPAEGSGFLPAVPYLRRFSSKSHPPYAGSPLSLLCPYLQSRSSFAILSIETMILSFVYLKVGIPEFLNGIGGGTEAHVAKLESTIGDFNKLLVTRTLGLKKLGIPCKHRKLILKYTHKYRLCLWRPRFDARKA